MNALQVWFADLGWTQYPIPRRIARAPRHIGMRLTIAALGLFGTIVFGVMTIGFAVLIAIYGYAAFTA